LRRPPFLHRAAVQAALAAASLATLAPALWVLDLALTPGGGSTAAHLPDPRRWSLANFAAVVSTRDARGEPLFWRQLASSLEVAGATTLVAIAAATTAAWAFSRFEFPGKRGGLRLFLVSQMFPAVVSAVPLYILLHAIGLTDSLLGLVLVYATSAVPFSIWMLKGFFDQIPRELDEAARLEGASRFFVFRRIALPLAAPGIAVTALFAFMSAWNEFVLAATFLKSEARYTLPVVLEGYVGPYGAQWGLFAAGSIVVSIPVVLLFYALQRRLVQGLAAGSVKG
jgi:arabinogalactan oligomer/maltooligosaccharide transport system permease protein